jgi:hypothetical protein
MTDSPTPAQKPAPKPGPKPKAKRPHHVYTLVVQVGRKPGDGLPANATGAALMVYSSGVSEDEAVREAVAILKQAGMAPLDVQGYGTPEDRDRDGPPVSDEERPLMARALDENAVIVAEVTPFHD